MHHLDEECSEDQTGWDYIVAPEVRARQLYDNEGPNIFESPSLLYTAINSRSINYVINYFAFI